jgi:hypothetical protein
VTDIVATDTSRVSRIVSKAIELVLFSVVEADAIRGGYPEVALFIFDDVVRIVVSETTSIVWTISVDDELVPVIHVKAIFRCYPDETKLILMDIKDISLR